MLYKEGYILLLSKTVNFLEGLLVHSQKKTSRGRIDTGKNWYRNHIHQTKRKEVEVYLAKR